MGKHLSIVLLYVCCLTHLNAQIPINGIDVLHYSFSVAVNDSSDVITGKATINTRFTKDVKQIIFDLVNTKSDGKGMRVSSVISSNKHMNYTQDAQHLLISEPARANDSAVYEITYSGIPADGLIISKNKFGSRTFFGDNWPNRAHNWLPCNDHVSDKATVDFTVTAPDHYLIISNGIKVLQQLSSNHFNITKYSENVPISTDLMVIGVSDFAVDSVGKANNKPVYSWVFQQNKDSGFKRYAIAKNIIEWYVERIAAFPFEKLANVQSKTIFGGMENAGCIFYFENSVDDKDLEALMAHEIAHQWFGDAVTEKDWPHLWLSEGFATYMAHLYHEDKYGEDSFNNRMKADRKKVIAFSKQRNTPVVDTTASDDLMQLLNANSYQKGSWVLHMLRRNIGDSLFWLSLKEYYTYYTGRNADTKDLQHVFEKVCKRNLDTFFQQWLYTTGEPSINISWSYNENKKSVILKIEQLQEQIFQFPFEILLQNTNSEIKQTISIIKRQTDIEIPVKFTPDKLIADPEVNLLAEIHVQPGG